MRAAAEPLLLRCDVLVVRLVCGMGAAYRTALTSGGNEAEL
jgi:hypothetical protein